MSSTTVVSSHSPSASMMSSHVHSTVMSSHSYTGSYMWGPAKHGEPASKTAGQEHVTTAYFTFMSVDSARWAAKFAKAFHGIIIVTSHGVINIDWLYLGCDNLGMYLWLHSVCVMMRHLFGNSLIKYNS